MELDDQFQAAVKVIQGLPINGPYQPSNDMKLKFYGYYKQATQGQCNQTKPSFWDVVGRAKWSAWNSCENMTKDEAKQLYIDEIKKVVTDMGSVLSSEQIKKIVETMSFTGEVSEFIKTLGPTFYEYVDESDDESMTVKEKEDSGIEADCKLDNEVLAILNQKPTDDNYYSDDSSVHSGSVETVQLGQRRVSGSSADEYHDPLTEFPRMCVGPRPWLDHPPSFEPNIAEGYKEAIKLLQEDLEDIKARLKVVEDSQKNSQSDYKALLAEVRTRENTNHDWPCSELSGKTVIFVLTWPFIAHGIIKAVTHTTNKLKIL